MKSLNEEVIVDDEDAINLQIEIEAQKVEGLYSEDDDISSDDIGVKSTSLQSVLPFKRDSLDEKEYKGFIKNCERLVRGSLEYKEFVSFCRSSLKADVCSLTGENNEETNDIELHHYPFTLYDICKIVIDDKMYKEVKFSSFDIALEVIKLHFCMFIGIVPLAGTLHKKYHNGFLDIPLQLVKGNYKKILEFYDVDPELESKIKLAENITTSPYLEGGWNSQNNALENKGSDNSTTEQISKDIHKDLNSELLDIFSDLKGE